MNGWSEAEKKIRRDASFLGLDVRKATNSRGNSDKNGGDSWYCFTCKTWWKDYRTFHNDQAMKDHMSDIHGAPATMPYLSGST